MEYGTGTEVPYDVSQSVDTCVYREYSEVYRIVNQIGTRLKQHLKQMQCITQKVFCTLLIVVVFLKRFAA